MNEPTPACFSDDAQRALDRLRREAVLSAQSRAKFVDLCARFFGFLESSHSPLCLAGVGAPTVEAFVSAPTAAGEPSIATMHLRRSALRLLFRIGRELDLASGDPTLDLKLPVRSSLKARPLADDEVIVCRSASQRTLEETRLPAAWALAERGVRTSEIGLITVRNLQRDGARVWVDGTPRTQARWVMPSRWGVTQLERRVRALRGCADQPLVYAGRSDSGYHRQAASCVAVSTVLRLAGLADEPDVRPLSVTGWAGRQVFAETGRIEKVAKALGVSSLDRAARLIAWDWDERAEAGE